MDLGSLNFEDPNVAINYLVVPLLGLIAVGFVIWALYLGRQVRATRKWLSAPGRVIVSELRQEQSTSAGGSRSFVAYYPRVVYEYQVGGQVYQGERIMFGSFSVNSTPDMAQRKLAKYPLGSTGEVFYNPANPSEAVLERAAPSTKLMWILAGCMVLLIIMLEVGLAFQNAMMASRGG